MPRVAGVLNEHTIAYSRTLDDCTRQLRSVYLPKIKQTFPVDKDGKLPPGVVKYLEVIGNEVFENMTANGEISSGKTNVDPDSDLLVEKTLHVSFSVQPTGTIGFINSTIALKSALN